MTTVSRPARTKTMVMMTRKKMMMRTRMRTREVKMAVRMTIAKTDVLLVDASDC